MHPQHARGCQNRRPSAIGRGRRKRASTGRVVHHHTKGVVPTTRAAAAVAAASTDASRYPAPLCPPRVTLCQRNVPCNNKKRTKKRGHAPRRDTRPEPHRDARAASAGARRRGRAGGGEKPRSEARAGGRKWPRRWLHGRGREVTSRPQCGLLGHHVRTDQHLCRTVGGFGQTVVGGAKSGITGSQ